MIANGFPTSLPSPATRPRSKRQSEITGIYSGVGSGGGGSSGGGSELLLDYPHSCVETGEVCQYWFDPCEVWEIKAADITISPVHHAGMGLVHPSRGMSLRFPRFIRKRPDKRVEHATTAQQIAAAFRAQAQRGGGAGSGVRGEGEATQQQAASRAE